MNSAVAAKPAGARNNGRQNGGAYGRGEPERVSGARSVSEVTLCAQELGAGGVEKHPRHDSENSDATQW